MVHLVYCDNTGKKGEKVLDKILSGRKTMIIRAAAGRKIPHSRVFSDESLYFLEKGSTQILVKAIVSNVQNLVKLSEEEIEENFTRYESKLNLTNKQRKRWHKKCMCLVEFSNVEEITPLEFEHQGNMDDWLIIDKIEDVLVGSSIPYNYDKSKF